MLSHLCYIYLLAFIRRKHIIAEQEYRIFKLLTKNASKTPYQDAYFFGTCALQQFLTDGLIQSQP